MKHNVSFMGAFCVCGIDMHLDLVMSCILQCFGIFAILTFFLFFCNELGDIITL